MNFEFATTGRIQFGEGVLDQVGEHAARLGRRAWLVTGSRSLEAAGVVDRIEHQLAQVGVQAVRGQIYGEPDTTVVDHGARLAAEGGCDLVVAIGGGSALDAAKAMACLLTNGGECVDYLEVVGRGQPITKPSAPFIAIPTTAGTGSEATRNAVVTHKESGTKASLRSVHLLPTVALLDPTLTHSLPSELTAATGLDALTQLIEPYVSRREHPVVDALALDAIRRVVRALPMAYRAPDHAAARAEMMYASLVSGICLAHAGLGVSHAFAAPLGASYPVPHGFACAATLPHAMRVNLEVARKDEWGEAAVARYAQIAQALGAGDKGGSADLAQRGVEIVAELCVDLGVPPLTNFGVTIDAIPSLVERAKATSSMKANPVDLDDGALATILMSAMQ